MAMSENEAIKNINALNAVCGQKDFYDEKFEKSLEMAIKALEEIQQYREIGTVEEIQNMKDQLLIVKDMCKDYYEIGTIEEFKALKEKSVAKKPKSNKVIVSHDSYAYCPHCKHCIELFKPSHCDRCGGELDWQ